MERILQIHTMIRKPSPAKSVTSKLDPEALAAVGEAASPQDLADMIFTLIEGAEKSRRGKDVLRRLVTKVRKKMPTIAVALDLA